MKHHLLGCWRQCSNQGHSACVRRRRTACEGLGPCVVLHDKVAVGVGPSVFDPCLSQSALVCRTAQRSHSWFTKSNFDVYPGPLIEEPQGFSAPNNISAMSCLCLIIAHAAVLSCPERYAIWQQCSPAVVLQLQQNQALNRARLIGGVSVPRPLQVAVPICIVAADSPALRKLIKWLLHSAFLGCGWSHPAAARASRQRVGCMSLARASQ